MPFRIALSGLHGASSDLSVTANNIANAASTGFKRSRAEFVDVYATAYGAMSSTSIGSGVRTANIRQLFSQGDVEYTENSTDLAITGQGFFVVADDTGRFLTRNGTFGVDREGYVINSTGQKLQVFPAVTVGNTTTYNTGRLTDLQLQNGVGAPVASNNILVNVNVDAQAPVNKNLHYDIQPAASNLFVDGYPATSGFPALDFNPGDPATFHHTTATTVYDSLGGAHDVTFYFRKLEDSSNPALNNTWQVFTEIDGTRTSPTNNGLPAGPTSDSPMLMTFNTDGTLNNTYYDDGTATGAATGGPIVFEDFVTTTGSAPLQLTVDFSSSTQYGSKFVPNEITQDGFTTGELAGFDVGKEGVVFARYTNGNKTVLGMVGMANVANPQALRQAGDTMWKESYDAGDTILGQPGTSNFGLIQSGALETSTVQIADELVQMIVAQRNYQANAQVISTADQITQTLLNIR